MQDIVLEDPALPSTGQNSDTCDDSSLDLRNAFNKEHMPNVGTADGASFVSDSIPMEDPTAINDISEQVTTAVVGLQVEENACNTESNVNEHLLSVEDVDMLLDKCLLQALHTMVKDKDLPIPGSILW